MTTVPLGELAELITKGTTPTTLGLSLAERGIPFLRAQNLVNGTVDPLIDAQFISVETHEALARSKIEPGDVLISIAGTIGRPAVVPEILTAANCNQAVAIIRTRPSLSQRYLLHWLSSADAVRQIARGQVTGTISNLSLGQLERLLVPLPPVPAQERIAAILDAADALRAKRRAALAKLDNLAQSIFIEMFGDPIANDRCWNVLPLDQIIPDDRPLTYGILMPGEDQVDGVLYVRVVDMKDGGIDVAGMRRTTEAISGQYKRSLLRGGDLLISIRGHVGRTALVPDELEGANITQDTARIASERFDLRFLQELLRHRSTQHWMARRTKGAAVKGINLGDLRQLPVISPPIREQREFGGAASGARTAWECMRRQFTAADALFASLQHRAFAGKL